MKHELERPPAAAATENDALFAAKAALKRAGTIRRDADAQLHALQRMIERLERKGPPSE